MAYLAIVSLLALIEFFVFGILVARARGKYGIKVPATSGHPVFDRTFRVQQNTLEQLVIFLPALWIFGQLLSPIWGAAIGVVFLIGRAVYAAGYIAEAEKRGPGFLIGTLANFALIAGGLYGAIARLLIA
jgi:glutathione S-transferase